MDPCIDGSPAPWAGCGCKSGSKPSLFLGVIMLFVSRGYQSQQLGCLPINLRLGVTLILVKYWASLFCFSLAASLLSCLLFASAEDTSCVLEVGQSIVLQLAEGLAAPTSHALVSTACRAAGRELRLQNGHRELHLGPKVQNFRRPLLSWATFEVRAGDPVSFDLAGSMDGRRLSDALLRFVHGCCFFLAFLLLVCGLVVEIQPLNCQKLNVCSP